ncbi:hypothetical protein [Desulfocicer niacini]
MAAKAVPLRSATFAAIVGQDIHAVRKTNRAPSLTGQYIGQIYQTKYFGSPQIAFSVENLFDEEHYDYSIGRERSYFLQLNLNW